MKTQNPVVLRTLDPCGISKNIFEVLFWIACLASNMLLFGYFLTLNDYLVQLAGSSLRPLQSAIRDSKPIINMWRILLYNGL